MECISKTIHNDASSDPNIKFTKKSLIYQGYKGDSKAIILLQTQNLFP